MPTRTSQQRSTTTETSTGDRHLLTKQIPNRLRPSLRWVEFVVTFHASSFDACTLDVSQSSTPSWISNAATSSSTHVTSNDVSGTFSPTSSSQSRASWNDSRSTSSLPRTQSSTVTLLQKNRGQCPLLRSPPLVLPHPLLCKPAWSNEYCNKIFSIDFVKKNKDDIVLSAVCMVCSLINEYL